MATINPEWLRTADAATVFGCSRQRLGDLRARGLLVEGRDFRIDGYGLRAPLVWRRASLEEVLVKSSGKSFDLVETL